MQENQAVECLKQGDISGLEFLVHRYQVQAIRTAYLIVRDRDLAEDIVQSAFIRAYDRIDQFVASRPFGPWFLKIVINASLKTVAKQGREVFIEDISEGEDETWSNQLVNSDFEPSNIIETADSQSAIWEALAKLSPAQRAAIVLRYYLDFSEADLAVELKRPRGTVKWLLHAARERLRQILEPAGKYTSTQPPRVPDKD